MHGAARHHEANLIAILCANDNEVGSVRIEQLAGLIVLGRNDDAVTPMNVGDVANNFFPVCP